MKQIVTSSRLAMEASFTETPETFGWIGKIAGKKLEDVTLVSTLRQTKEGFVYLSVPDEIIDAFLKMIDATGIVAPEKGSKKTYPGAHISVMRSEESEKIDRQIKEIGQEFAYTLDGMYRVEPEGWEDVKEVFFLTVKSPQLESLRRKYKLPAKINGHDFHISVAVRLRNDRREKSEGKSK